MIHGDDKGLVLPPQVSPVQVVVIPVPYKNVDSSVMLDACRGVSQKLEGSGIRVKEDTRDNYPPGWKYSDWELKGVPLRIEIGPKDIENKQVYTLFLLMSYGTPALCFGIAIFSMLEQGENVYDKVLVACLCHRIALSPHFVFKIV